MTNTADTTFEARLQRAIDTKTKPVGALGRIEDVAAQIARIQQALAPNVETCSLAIFAADHGMAASGVSAYPQDVTRQMVQNFLAGGAAANVFARALDVEIQVIDAGVAGPAIEHPALINRRIAAGTRNAIQGPAMTDTEFRHAYDAGLAIGEQTKTDVACFGEMGIGNTSSATLIASKLLGASVAELVGRGAGLDDAGLAQKTALLEKAASRTRPAAECANCALRIWRL